MCRALCKVCLQMFIISVSVGQEFGGAFVGWFWFTLSELQSRCYPGSGISKSGVRTFNNSNQPPERLRKLTKIIRTNFSESGN